FGPDGNLYVISNDPGHVKVLRYDGSSGAPLGTFVDLGAGSASAIEFGPDGNLYLATISETGVLRFNGATGAAMGVAASGNGIRRAGGIDFGPDGKLYVLDSDRAIDVSADRVLRFDPTNGAFIDQFVSPGQLNDAVFLTFGPDNHLYVPDINQFHDVRRFSGSTGKFLGVFANSPDPTHNSIFDIQFGPDGNAYAATGKDIFRFDGETGRLLDTFITGSGESLTFFPPVGPTIDLAVSSIDIPVGVVQGNDLSITYTVTNTSSSATLVNSWEDVVYLSTDDLFDPSDVEFGRIGRTSGLAGGASYTETLTSPLSTVSLGDYHVFVFADRRGVLNDAARLNNLGLATNTFEVFPPLASSHDPDHSVAVGRTLSAYTTADITNNLLTINYTVYNLTDGYTRDTLLITTLDPNVALVHASHLPDQNGQELAWSLGTISPFGRASVEITVSLNSLLSTQLDTGASAFATIDTFAVADAAPAAKLRTDVIDPLLLASTLDANITDPFIQSKAAELDYDPQLIFNFLSTDIGYESYVGSLRGARGTLWSGAGNSLDETSLGVALFRASGIPARYAHGTLSDPLSQQLILSMFPESFQTVGYIPIGTEVADPANDPQLLLEARDHYWLQADTGLGFQNADSSGLPGGVFGTPFTIASNTFNEVADELRHKAQVSLEAEMYNSASALFGGLGGGGFSTSTVLELKMNDVELVGRPITIGNFVVSSALNALAFGSQTNTFTPYLILGDAAYASSATDQLVTGINYQEVLTNFPFGSQVLTGLVLTIAITSPNSAPKTYSHTILDRVGEAARQTGQ
ncbi:MAG: transglutaminase domain-containing protein, partial [Aureliella sp.]